MQGLIGSNMLTIVFYYTSYSYLYLVRCNPLINYILVLFQNNYHISLVVTYATKFWFISNHIIMFYKPVVLYNSAYSSDLISHTWRYNKRLGKDSQGLNHKAISIKHVFRVHNDQLWNIYSKSFSQQLPTDNNIPNDTSYNGDLIISGLTSHLEDNPILTKTVPAFIDMINYNNHKYPFPLKDSEVHLFHGTKRKNVKGIVRNGFDLSKAKRGLYGKALYLAESSEKADQYTGRVKS